MKTWIESSASNRSRSTWFWALQVYVLESSLLALRMRSTAFEYPDALGTSSTLPNRSWLGSTLLFPATERKEKTNEKWVYTGLCGCRKPNEQKCTGKPLDLRSGKAVRLAFQFHRQGRLGVLFAPEVVDGGRFWDKVMKDKKMIKPVEWGLQLINYRKRKTIVFDRFVGKQKLPIDWPEHALVRSTREPFWTNVTIAGVGRKRSQTEDPRCWSSWLWGWKVLDPMNRSFRRRSHPCARPQCSSLSLVLFPPLRHLLLSFSLESRPADVGLHDPGHKTRSQVRPDIEVDSWAWAVFVVESATNRGPAPAVNAIGCRKGSTCSGRNRQSWLFEWSRIRIDCFVRGPIDCVESIWPADGWCLTRSAAEVDPTEAVDRSTTRQVTERWTGHSEWWPTVLRPRVSDRCRRRRLPADVRRWLTNFDCSNRRDTKDELGNVCWATKWSGRGCGQGDGDQEESHERDGED